MTLRILVVLAFLAPAAGWTQTAPEVLFVGQLERLELIPRERQGCRDPESTEGRIYLSNHCGCAKAEFSVDNAVVPAGIEEYTINYSVGEWCEPGIDLFGGTKYLVYKVPDGRHRWIGSKDIWTGEYDLFEGQLQPILSELQIRQEQILFKSERINSCNGEETDASCTLESIVGIMDFLRQLELLTEMNNR